MQVVQAYIARNSQGSASAIERASVNSNEEPENMSDVSTEIVPSTPSNSQEELTHRQDGDEAKVSPVSERAQGFPPLSGYGSTGRTGRSQRLGSLEEISRRSATPVQSGRTSPANVSTASETTYFTARTFNSFSHPPRMISSGPVRRHNSETQGTSTGREKTPVTRNSAPTARRGLGGASNLAPRQRDPLSHLSNFERSIYLYIVERTRISLSAGVTQEDVMRYKRMNIRTRWATDNETRHADLRIGAFFA